jgi:hypothetical protein
VLLDHTSRDNVSKTKQTFIVVNAGMNLLEKGGSHVGSPQWKARAAKKCQDIASATTYFKTKPFSMEACDNLWFFVCEGVGPIALYVPRYFAI